MLTKPLALLFFPISTLALQAFVNVNTNDFSAMLARGASLSKRQSGYSPETRPCGRGNTCEEACGPNQTECPSGPSTLFCHSTLDGSKCCADGSGYACGADDYCTTNGSGTTYCCPNGTDPVECARRYSLTIALIQPTFNPTVPSRSILPLVPSGSTTPIVPTVATPSAVLPTTRSFTGLPSPIISATRTASSSPSAVATGGAAIPNVEYALAMGMLGAVLL